MQIRHPAPGDRAAMCALWEEAFCADDFCNPFFDTLYRAENSLAAYINGELCAMLHSVFYRVDTPQQTLRGRYLYAAATAKAHRKQGLFTALHRAMADDTDADFLFLIPETAALREFYLRRGYTDFGIRQISDLPPGFAKATEPKGALYRRYLAAAAPPCLYMDEASFCLTVSDKLLFTSSHSPEIYIRTQEGYTSFGVIANARKTDPAALILSPGGVRAQIPLPFLLN